MTPVTLAQAIPLKVRQVIYSVLATLVGLELVLDVVHAGVESKIMGVLIVLGFGTALSNTATPKQPPLPAEVPPGVDVPTNEGD